nr:hypothetical protein [Tanacetum cinerariifolium]
QEGTGCPDDLAHAHGSHRLPRSGAGGRRAQGARLSRPDVADTQSRRACAVAQSGHPPHRQHGALHVVLRRREDVGRP